MIKILLVNLTGQMAGAEHSLLLLAQHLCTNFTFTLACPKSGPLTQNFSKLGIATLELPKPPTHKFISPTGLFYWCHISLVLLKVMIVTRPNLIHANTFAALACSLLPARLTGKWLIAHARDFQRQLWLTRLLGLSCNQIIAVSHSVKKHLVTQGINPEKIIVIHNGVEPPLASPANHRSRDLFTFAHVGQFVPWKNQILFLQAAAQFLQKKSHARFLLIGDDIFHRDDQYKQKIEATINQLNLTNHVECLGWKSNMTHVWPRVNVLVHTATAEPFGRVIVEALAHAIPVIAINRNGPAEILQHGPSTLLVDSDSPSQFANAMHKIFRTPYPLPSSVAERIAQTFSASKTALQVAHLYENILKGTSHANRHTLSYL